MSLCNQICTLCPSLPSCPTDILNECENIKICGLVNCTEVKNTDTPAEDSILYCFRLSLENCTGKELCNSTLELALKWKYRLASQDGNIFQGFFSLIDEAAIEYSITSNLPNFNPASAWTGDGTNIVVGANFSIPTGKFVVEICVQVLKSAIETLIGEDCALPALFPSVLELTARSAKNNSCPVVVTSLIACSPSAISVESVPVVPP